jgi:Leucine-rich repeat (LRR) protein
MNSINSLLSLTHAAVSPGKEPKPEEANVPLGRDSTTMRPLGALKLVRFHYSKPIVFSAGGASRIPLDKFLKVVRLHSSKEQSISRGGSLATQRPLGEYLQFVRIQSELPKEPKTHSPLTRQAIFLNQHLSFLPGEEAPAPSWDAFSNERSLEVEQNPKEVNATWMGDFVQEEDTSFRFSGRYAPYVPLAPVPKGLALDIQVSQPAPSPLALENSAQKSDPMDSGIEFIPLREISWNESDLVLSPPPSGAVIPSKDKTQGGPKLKFLKAFSRDIHVLIARFLISTPYLAKNNRAFFFTCKELQTLEKDVLYGNNAAVNSILHFGRYNLNCMRGIKGPAPLQKDIRALGKTFTSIQLSSPKLDSEEVCDLVATFPNLRALHISKNKTQDEHLLLMGRFFQLETLSFSHCENVDNMLDLFQMHNITHLRLENTSDTPVSSAALAVIRKMERIEKLELVNSFPNIEPDTVLDHFSSLQSLTELNLSKNSRIDNAFILGLSKLTSLRSIELSHLEAHGLKLDLTPLSFLPNLRELDLSHTNSNRFDETLASLTQLEILIARYCKFGNGTLIPVRSLVNLKELYLDGNDNITDRCFSFFTKLEKLEVLSLENCNGRIRHSGMMLHLPNLQNLRVLYLGGLKGIHDYAFSGFPKLQKLQKLDLSQCEFVSKSPTLHHLIPLANLKEINLNNAEFSKENLSSLKKLIQLKTVSMRNIKVVEELPLIPERLTGNRPF